MTFKKLLTGRQEDVERGIEARTHVNLQTQHRNKGNKKRKSYVYSSNILSKMILLVAVRRENIAE